MDQLRSLQQLINGIDTDIGLVQLRQWGINYGFSNNYFRNIAWSRLLGINTNEYEFVETAKCGQHEQLLKDVYRSFNTIVEIKNYKHMYNHIHISDQLRECLMDVLDTMYSIFPQYQYYQGYHDIASIFMLVMGVENGYRASIKVGQYYFRDYLEKEFMLSLMPQISIVHEIILRYSREYTDRVLFTIMNEVPQPMCLIAWILTWFSHSIERMQDICRIWDYLLCQDPSMILYVCAAFIIEHKSNIDISCIDEIAVSFQEVFQEINKSIPSLNIERVLSLATVLSCRYHIADIVTAKVIPIMQTSLILKQNFRIPYQQALLDRQSSLKYRLQQFYVHNKLVFINALGILASVAIEKYILS